MESDSGLSSGYATWYVLTYTILDMESPLSPPMTSLTRAIQLAPARSPPRAIHFIFESIHYVVRKVNNRAVSSLSCDPTQPSPASQYSPASSPLPRHPATPQTAPQETSSLPRPPGIQ